MQINFKSNDIWLLVIVALMALGANLPDAIIGHAVDRNLLLVALVVTVFISLFRYLKFMLFLTVSVLAIGANLPEQLAKQLGLSQTAFIVASGILVVVALVYKLYDYRKSNDEAAEEYGYEETVGPEIFVSQLRDTIESRNYVLSAIMSGDFATLHQLLVSDVEVNFSQDGRIPIFLAVEKGNSDIVLLLLIHGAKLKIKNQYGLTPTDIALKLRFARIAKILHYAETQNMAIQNRATYSSQITRKVAVVFADICGSTSLYDLLGNEAALNMVTRTLNLLKQETAKHKGTLIKTIGDEVMCTFPNALLAVQAARAMHISIDAEKPGGELPVSVRIGIHFGEVILKANDVFGDTVNVAGRIASITRARQIVTSQAVINALPIEYKDKIVPINRTSVRGKKDSLAMFQVLWETVDSVHERVGVATERRRRVVNEQASDNLQSDQSSAKATF
jgi:class 3 adenylate cyclase